MELEQSADRAAARGGVAAAAAFLQRSVELTRDPARRTDRALAAAQASMEAGAFETALGLLAAAEAGVLDEFGRARVDLLRAEAAFAQQRGSDAPHLLLRAAQTLESLDVRLARDTYLDAWGAALFAGRLATAGSLREVSQAARAAPRPEGPPRGSDRLLDGFALLFTEGPCRRGAGTGTGSDRVLGSRHLRRRRSFDGVGSPRRGPLSSGTSRPAWPPPPARSRSPAPRVRSRSSPSASTCSGRSPRSQVTSPRRRSLKAEADAVREATGTHVARYGALVLAALQGRPARRIH